MKKRTQLLIVVIILTILLTAYFIFIKHKAIIKNYTYQVTEATSEKVVIVIKPTDTSRKYRDYKYEYKGNILYVTIYDSLFVGEELKVEEIITLEDNFYGLTEIVIDGKKEDLTIYIKE